MIAKKLFTLAAFISLTVTTVFSQTDEFHLDKTYQLDANGTVLLHSDDAEVTIRGSDRQDVHVVVDYILDVDGVKFGDYEPFDMKVRQEDGKLYIKEQPREMDAIVIGDTDESYTITIEVPQAANLKLNGDDEHYKITNINGKIRVDADDADVNCINCGGNLFGIRLDDGTVTMNTGRGILKLDVDDGNATINNGSFKKIKVRADDGSFKIQNRAASGGVYKFNVDDGSLNLQMNAGSNRTDAIKVGVRTDDGDINISTQLNENDEYQFNADDADIEFAAVDGGGVFRIIHDDAGISSNGDYRILRNEEGLSEYRLNNGGATIKMDVDDADIELK